ncbi:L,D-transpeptidase [Corynebacterium qintianiae]|uniref:L,D-transpeptidase n=1 Tax=Corynebacterium qintianiae TaxID=2709392 RepID=A0A7T0KNE7_9CORY|nr:L,D-transpeptidase [Corynebacterium qintianiae]QPK83559.1 L,D-transpeptidase [Corynebacterium qintianiae]
MSNTPRHRAPSRAKRRAAAIAASVGALVALAGVPAVAQAQEAPVSSANSLDAFVQHVNYSLTTSTRDNAWYVRNTLLAQAGTLAAINPAAPEQARAQIDQIFEALFPGLIAERTPRPEPAPAPAAAPAPAPAPAFDYGACPKDAKVCVDIAGQRSWLQNGGQVYYGAVTVATGKPGYETPRGTFYVNRKIKDEISWEFGNAPMPFATYFTYNGIAFHQGDPAYKSHGCVRMYRQDAERYFNDLQIGDKVVVY